MTASRWPIRWVRSSAWSCIAGVHSSSRKATFDARVSVMPCAATRVAPTMSCGPSGRWNARTASSRSPRASAPSRCAASGKRSSTARWMSTWRAKTTSGSPDSRKSAIHCSAALSLPRAARRWSVVSCARRSARSVAAMRALSSERSSGCSRSQAIDVLLGEPVLALVVERDRAPRRAASAGSWGRTSLFSRRTKQRRRRCQCRRSSVSGPWNWREKRAPEPKSSSRPMTRSWLMSSSAWLRTGVPVSARRSA